MTSAIWWPRIPKAAMAAALAILAFTAEARAEGGESSVWVRLRALFVTPDPDGSAEAGPVENATPLGESAPSSRKAGRRGAVEQQRVAALQPLVQRIAGESGVPFELADAVVRLESRYQPRVRNGANLGLTQINHRTAAAMGYSGPQGGLLDAETNLRFGLKYLAQAYRLAKGDLCGTILRYQAGHRAVRMTRSASLYCARVRTLIAGPDDRGNGTPS
jgi:soluble lytic murein transglycosylase-like protein